LTDCTIVRHYIGIIIDIQYSDIYYGDTLLVVMTGDGDDIIVVVVISILLMMISDDLM